MLINGVKTGWKLLAAVSLMFLLCPPDTNAQSNGTAKQTDTFNETFESFLGSKVLNIVMPKTVDLSGEISMALTVRIEPSFDEEFQFVFLKKRNGEVEFIKKHSAAGNIRYKIADLEQETALTAIELAKLINVLETRTVIPPAKFKQMFEELDIAVRQHERREAARREDEERRRKAGEYIASNSRDGTRYVIWTGGEKEYDIAVLGHSYKSSAQKGESPLIAWVRNLVKDL